MADPLSALLGSTAGMARPTALSSNGMDPAMMALVPPQSALASGNAPPVDPALIAAVLQHAQGLASGTPPPNPTPDPSLSAQDVLTMANAPAPSSGAGAMNVSSGDPNANLAALHALLSQAQNPGVMSDAQGFPTTAAASAMEGQDAAMQKQIAALTGASGALQDPNVSFANKLGQANTALTGAGVDPTKFAGGNTGAPDLSSRQSPQDILASAAAKNGMAGDVGANPTAMPSGQVLNGSWVPDSLLAGKSPVAPALPMSAVKADVNQIKKEEANPQRQAMDALLAQKQGAAQNEITSQAILGKHLRNLEKLGLSPQGAADEEARQSLLSSMSKQPQQGGHGGDEPPPDPRISVINPQLYDSLMSSWTQRKTLSNQQKAIDNTAIAAQAGRVQDIQLRRAQQKDAYMKMGHSEADSDALSKRDVPISPLEQQQGGGNIPPPPTPGAGGGPISAEDKTVQKSRDIESLPPSGAATYDGRKPFLDALATRDEITNDPARLAAVAKSAGFTDAELERQETEHNNVVSNFNSGGDGMDMFGKPTEGSPRLKAAQARIAVLKKIRGALHPS